jgi:hypothetical protein
VKLGIGVIVTLVLVYLIAWAVPFEPADARPGARLAGSAMEGDPVPWEGRRLILVETRPWYGIRHSITTTAWWHDGELHVPCGDCAAKRWPHNVANDPRVRLKIDDAIYERRAVRITDEAEHHAVLGEPMAGHRPEGVWIFRMERI